jgi:hypothetical protein
MAIPCPPVVCDVVGGAAKSAAREAASATFGAFVDWLAGGARWLLAQVVGLLGQTTQIDLGARWFLAHETTMQKVALLVVAPLLLAAVIGAVARQDMARLARIAGVYLPVAVLGGFLAVQLTQTALALTDGLCATITQGFGGDVQHALDNITRALAAMGDPLNGGVVAAGAAMLVVLGVLFIWLELVARTAAVYVAVLFLPLTLAGLVWPTTARWARRLVELLVALVLSKFVIVAVVSLGAGALAQSDGISEVLAGAALLLVAAFAPFTLLRLVPVVEAGLIGHLEGLSHRPINASVGAASLPAHPVVQQLRNMSAAGFDPSAVGPVPITGDRGAGEPAADAVGRLPSAGGPGLTEGWWERDAGWPAPATAARAAPAGGAGDEP